MAAEAAVPATAAAIVEMKGEVRWKSCANRRKSCANQDPLSCSKKRHVSRTRHIAWDLPALSFPLSALLQVLVAEMIVTEATVVTIVTVTFLLLQEGTGQ